MLELILSFVPVVFGSSMLVSVLKYLSVMKNSKAWLRFGLVVFSGLGVLAHGVYTDQPIDFNQISDLAKTAIEIAFVALAAHFSYRFTKTA